MKRKKKDRCVPNVVCQVKITLLRAKLTCRGFLVGWHQNATMERFQFSVCFFLFLVMMLDLVSLDFGLTY